MRFPEWIKNPHGYFILFLLILLATLATWTLPAGEYQRVKDPHSGKTVVDPVSYTVVESQPVSLFKMLQAIPTGFRQSAGIIAFVFLIAGAIQIIRATGALDAGIIAAVKFMQGKDTPLLVCIMLVFALLGAFFGFAEETIPLIPLGVAMALALGYDRVVGFHLVRTAAWVGFAGAIMNPFTIGVAQSIAEVPLYSGIGYRVVCFLVFFVIAAWFILRYARSCKGDPSKSILWGYKEEEGEMAKYDLDYSMQELTLVRKLILLLLLSGIGIQIWGVIKYEWYTTEISALFLGVGLLAGILARMNPTQLFREFVNGAKGVTYGALIIGFARAIVVILENGKVLDTVVYGFAMPLAHVGSVGAGVVMFLVQSGINFFIGSGSGQAAATMPIMTPLSDLVGVTRQTAVLAFQFGDGITNMFYPAMIYYLAFADIPYDRWVRHIAKLTLLLTVAGGVLVAVAAWIGYGPF
jgi:uncharacterized ion transporter superfamily protein YfcC